MAQPDKESGTFSQNNFDTMDDIEMFNAEDEMIEKELERLTTPEVGGWARQHGLMTHPLVAKRLRFWCQLCDANYDRPNKLEQHMASKHRNVRYPCTKCHKTYAGHDGKKRHEATCTGTTLQTYDCPKCERKCAREYGLQKHLEVCGQSRKRPASTKTAGSKKPRLEDPRFHCRRCQANFENKRDLYLHGMREHYGAGVQLQPSPYGDGPFPWDFENGETDHALKEVYEANAPLILENHRIGPVHSVYNKPLTNDVEIESLMMAANDIFERQRHAFKLTMTFGFILVHTEEHRYRFYKPYGTDSIFEEPMFISKRSDLQKLRRKLMSLNLRDHLMKQRENTKWKPHLITNVLFVVDSTNYPLGKAVDLPDFVKSKKSLHALVYDKRRQCVYDDNLCAFRCLSLHRGYSVEDLEKSTQHLYRMWREFKGENVTEAFAGIQLTDLPDVEACFGVNVNAYQLREDDTALVVYLSAGDYETTMVVNVYENHLSYVQDFEVYAKKYQCDKCERLFDRHGNVMKHQKTCTNETKYIYPGGFVKPPQTVFEKLEEYDICVDEKDRTFPWFATFDFESLLQKVPERGGKLVFTTKHVPISVSICSNVEEFEEPICFVEEDLDALLGSMIDHLDDIAESVREKAEMKWGWAKEALSRQRDDWEEDENKTMDNRLKNLYGELEGYMTQVPVLGFNSAKYDLNLVKQKLAMYLELHSEAEERPFVVKKSNSYVCLSNSRLKFLDMSQYLAPGTSYANFLKAYNVEEAKGFFPYEFMDDVSKLEGTCLPPKEAFHSSLRGTDITEENYDYCQNIWKKHGMQTMKDFLVWYNNLDVGPFVTAVERFLKFFYDRHIDPFKIAISTPGIARRMLFQTAKKAGASFALFDESNKDLHTTFSENLIGGPSIIFTRYHEADKTQIRNGPHTAKRVVGYDANCLYLWALGQDMPVGPFIRRKREKGFVPECRDRYMMAYHWMEHLNRTTSYNIRHKLNHGCEKRVGKYLMDGFCENTNTLFEFEGCYFHGHQCYMTANIKDERWLQEREMKYRNTLEKIEYLQSKGYRVVVMWECEFKQMQKHPEVKQVIEEGRPTFYRKHPRKVSEQEILGAVEREELFGMVQVDIEVPKTWSKGRERPLSPADYFGEMSPLFCNTEVEFDAFGPHMQAYVETSGLSKNARRLLVGGMKAECILIATPLLRWYLRHGMQVTQIHEVIEFQSQRCFGEFEKEVTKARRMGDEHQEMESIGNCFKLLGNSGYGSLCLDKRKHRNVKYVQGDNAAGRLVNEPLFRRMECISEEDSYYEVELAKAEIKLDIPIQLAYMILQYAKLRMLEFYYDFLDEYLDRSDFELIETDTDSLYFAISKRNLEETVKEEKRGAFQQELMGHCNGQAYTAEHHWFPRKCCNVHAKYDKRTGGLFKLEYEGKQAVALSSKSYVVADPDADKEKVKFSCKGVNKASVEDPWNKFHSVLTTKKTINTTNRGFRSKDNTVFTYKQEKIGWNYFYVKRRVLEDGIHTEPLDITLCPVGTKKIKKQ